MSKAPTKPMSRTRDPVSPLPWRVPMQGRSSPLLLGQRLTEHPRGKTQHVFLVGDPKLRLQHRTDMAGVEPDHLNRFALLFQLLLVQLDWTSWRTSIVAS